MSIVGGIVGIVGIVGSCVEEAVCEEAEDGSTGVALALVNSRAAVNKITCIFDTLSPYAYDKIITLSTFIIFI